MSVKRIEVNNINDGDILAKDAIMSNGTIVMNAGVMLKKEYITKLKELGVAFVYIVYEGPDFNVDISTEKKIQEQCKKSVRETLDKYSYFGNVELREIAKVAEEIMEDILTEPHVMYNVSRVRDNSDSTYSHSINVSALSILIALKMKLNKKRVREIAVGALLHDIGSVFIPFDYSAIEFEKLTEEQIKQVKNHVITGFTVIEKEKWLSAIAKDIILSHHERCDGTGYPMHKDAKHIKLESKIVGVCDTFDSGVYGNFSKKMKVHEVIDYIISQAGSGFEFNIVEAFISSVAAYPVGTFVLTNEGEMGVVIRQNEKFPTRPVIRMVTDVDGKEYTSLVEKNLIKELTLFIRDTL